MKSKAIIIFTMAVLTLSSFSQSQVNLSFTGVVGTDPVQLDSVKIFYVGEEWGWFPDTMLTWPDTTIYYELPPSQVLGFVGYWMSMPVGTPDKLQGEKQFHLFQNYPNPAYDRSTVSLFLPKRGRVDFSVTDLSGRLLLQSSHKLDRGGHSFTFTPGAGNFYILTANWEGDSQSIKIIATSDLQRQGCVLEYSGSHAMEPPLKGAQVIEGIRLESGMMDSPDADTTYVFQFAADIPCPGMPTVEYEGQVYNTVQIFSQCWLKENLNVGTQIPKDHYAEDNGIIEKYCYDDEPDSCLKYGGLYPWGEMMQYVIEPGSQGICPEGWRIPTDSDWMILEAVADSLHGIGDFIWFNYNPEEYRGYDAGQNLKTTTGWMVNLGNLGTDELGFSALPGGASYQEGWHGYQYNGVLSNGHWFSSSHLEGELYNYYLRIASADENGIQRNTSQTSSWSDRNSVRCVKGEMYNTDIPLTFTGTNNGTYVQLDSVRVYITDYYNNISDIVTLYWPDTTLVLGVDLQYENGYLNGIGYDGSDESGLVLNPWQVQDFTFQFAVNIPCPGLQTISYENQTYHTIQIKNQCWLRENLNIGTMIDGNNDQLDNGIVEKYCYNNNAILCTIYGGLYQWNEMLQYDEYNYQGICPPGWHIPTSKEWNILEGTSDSQYGIDDPIWNSSGYRGFDAGKNLKTTSNWSSNGNGTDLYGFSGKPGGFRALPNLGGFTGKNEYGEWWASSYPPSRRLAYDSDGIIYVPQNEFNGHSVRCLKD